MESQTFDAPKTITILRFLNQFKRTYNTSEGPEGATVSVTHLFMAKPASASPKCPHLFKAEEETLSCKRNANVILRNYELPPIYLRPVPCCRRDNGGDDHVQHELHRV